MPMTVKAILSRKSNNVVTISPAATLFDAVKILDAHRIGAVVVAIIEQ
jgi:CBS domain-containing protein